MRPGRPALPREHGTARGYRQHRRRGEAICGSCKDAGDAARRQQAETVRAEQEARRERWREQDQPRGEAGR
jgi:hypothetical protein